MRSASDEVDASSGPHRLDAECDTQVRLAGAGWPDEVNRFAAVDELQLGKRQDTPAIERGLEAEVEAGEGLQR